LKLVLLNSASAVYQLTFQEKDQIVEKYNVNSTCPETRQTDAHSAKLLWRTNIVDNALPHTLTQTASIANPIELDVRFSKKSHSCALLIDALAQVRHVYVHKSARTHTYTHTHTHTHTHTYTHTTTHTHTHEISSSNLVV
jgi:uncharacterized Zn finger protein